MRKENEEKMFKIDKKTDELFYRIGWGVIAVVVILGGIIVFTGKNPLRLLGPCLFHLLTGYYCPGCGGTRAVRFLLQGQFWDSFRYHPLVLYTAAVGGWFMMSQTIERMSRGRISIGMHFRDVYLWIALGIVVVNFLIKNLVLIILNIDLLS